MYEKTSDMKMKKYEQIKGYLPPTEICDYQPKQESIWNIV